MAATRLPAVVPLIATAAAALMLAGCGSDAKKAASPEAQVRAVVARYGKATADKDYQEICDELIAKQLSDNVEQFGLPCESAFQQGLASVLGAKLRIDGVRVAGNTAFAQVHTSATNQPPADVTLRLTRVGNAWKILSLRDSPGPAVTPPQSKETAPPPSTKTTEPRSTETAPSSPKVKPPAVRKPR